MNEMVKTSLRSIISAEYYSHNYSAMWAIFNYLYSSEGLSSGMLLDLLSSLRLPVLMNLSSNEGVPEIDSSWLLSMLMNEFFITFAKVSSCRFI